MFWFFCGAKGLLAYWEWSVRGGERGERGGDEHVDVRRSFPDAASVCSHVLSVHSLPHPCWRHLLSLMRLSPKAARLACHRQPAHVTCERWYKEHTQAVQSTVSPASSALRRHR